MISWIKIKSRLFSPIFRFHWNHFRKGVDIGKGFKARNRFSLTQEGKGKLFIGRDVFFNNDCSIVCRGLIRIGEDCLFGENVHIDDSNHTFSDVFVPIRKQGFSQGHITVGKNCWIGSNVFLGKNACIGNHCVISANMIVNFSVPDNTLVKRNQDGKIVFLPIQKEEKEPLVSIIVPCYNVASYLEACVLSLKKQTYSNTEVILVDDGSTDRTAELVDSLSDGKTIFGFHKENGGLSDARNFGLSKGKGEFVTFVDSDDILDPNFLFVLMNAIQKGRTDVACCQFSRFSDGETPAPWNLKTLPYSILESDEAQKAMFQQIQFDTSAWGKVYRSSLFDKISFPKGKSFEDLFTTYKIFEKTPFVSFVPLPLYFYRRNQFGIMHSYSPKQIQDYQEINQVLFDNYKERETGLRYAVFLRLFVNYSNAFFSVSNRKSELGSCLWGKIREFRPYVFRTKKKKSVALGACLSFLGRRAYWKLGQIKRKKQ